MGRAFRNRCDVSEVSAAVSRRTLRRQNGWTVGGEVGRRSWEEVRADSGWDEGRANLLKEEFILRAVGIPREVLGREVALVS